MWSHDIVGAATGVHWRWQFQRDRVYANGERYCATDDSGEHALVHLVPKEPLWPSDHDLQEMFAADVARARRAIEVARLPEVATSEHLRRLLDTAETDYCLTQIWEWADQPLHEHLKAGNLEDDLADAVAANVGAGLETLHRLNLVHCDVAPNNVLRVDGIWRLADFDNCTAVDEPVRALTRLTRYVPQGATIGMPANPSLDLEALHLLTERIRAIKPSSHED